MNLLYKKKDNTYFGVTVSEKPSKGSLENINIQKFIQEGLKFGRHQGNAKEFSNLIKDGSLVKVSVGSGKDNYNSSIYRVEEIIEVTCCREKKKGWKYEGRGTEVKDGPNKRWEKYQYIFLQPFNQRGHNIRLVVSKGRDDLKKNIVNESSLNSFLYKNCYTSDKNITDFISEFREASLKEKTTSDPSLHKSKRRLYSVVIPPDTLLAENLEVNTTEVISHII